MICGRRCERHARTLTRRWGKGDAKVTQTADSDQIKGRNEGRSKSQITCFSGFPALGKAGFEPARPLRTENFKSSASANSATRPGCHH